jgi:Fur family transcriptional regulator, peroxide stress response regulator
MPNAEARFTELIAALRDRDFRLTPQRMELIHLIAASEGHPSAAQLYSQIQAKFPTISQATVYKTLTLLKEINQVLEIDLRDDSHYDGNRLEPHAHLVCLKCNKIEDGELKIDSETIRALEKESGYQISRTQMVFYGLCSDCRKKEE